MDVKFWALAAFLFLAACGKSKTVESVFSENQKTTVHDVTVCDQAAQQIKTSFVVEWENGRVSVEKSENVELFKERFVRPNLKDIRHVEFNSTISLKNQGYSLETRTDDVPNWGQNMVRAASAWSQDIKGQGVLVAIVDTAVDYTHPLLRDQMIAGWDYVSNSAQASRPHSHATHIAGVIGAKEGGSVQGLAPAAKMMGVSFLDYSGTGETGNAILALQYAADHGAKIINNSWGGPECSSTMRTVMAGLEKKGVLLLVAAGNEGSDIEVSPEYPAAFNLPNQLTIAANDITDTMTGFSNNSWHLVQFSAPGDGIYSTVPGGYAYMSGTSMATPFAAGAAALLAGLRPGATPAQLRQALINSVDVGRYRVSTQGRLNIEKAIQEIKKLVP